MTEQNKTVERITNETCRIFLAAMMDHENFTTRDAAKAIGCGESTVQRILVGQTMPSDEMLKQIGIMAAIGFGKYKKLSEADKEKISETIGAVGGGILGFGSITAAVSAAGTVAGLGAAGIASGLAAIGAIVGGGMVAGILTVAAIPIAAGAFGYAIIKGIKAIFEKQACDEDRFDPAWETPKI
jgi:hypothetical protein